MSEDKEPKGTGAGGRFRSKTNPETEVILEGDSEPLAWPKTAYEEREIGGALRSTEHTRHQKVIQPTKYFAAVTPEIAEIPFISVPPDVATLTGDASVEIARFDQEFGGEIGSFTAMILRSESASSSELERLTAGADEIALAEIGIADVDSNAALIAANTSSMKRALELADSLDGDSIIAMHEALLAAHQPEWTGRWRTGQVRIGGATLNTARFVPPHADRVPAAMDDLVRFIQRDDLPVFEQAAVAHAHFETVHPFPDGNGRTGRSIIHAMMKRQGLTRFVTIPVSAGLLAEPDAYFDALTEYRKGNHVDIIRLLGHASFHAISNGRRLALDLQEAKSRWRDVLKVRSDASSLRLLDVIIQQPAIDVDFVQRELSLAQSTAETAIRQLVEVGILEPANANRRNRRWLAKDVVKALDDFAGRAKRRRLG